MAAIVLQMNLAILGDERRSSGGTCEGIDMSCSWAIASTPCRLCELHVNLAYMYRIGKRTDRQTRLGQYVQILLLLTYYASRKICYVKPKKRIRPTRAIRRYDEQRTSKTVSPEKWGCINEVDMETPPVRNAIYTYTTPHLPE